MININNLVLAGFKTKPYSSFWSEERKIVEDILSETCTSIPGLSEVIEQKSIIIPIDEYEAYKKLSEENKKYLLFLSEVKILINKYKEN